MATKKNAENKTTVVTPVPELPADEISQMNIYKKLMFVRKEFLASNVKKSGVNLHAEFQYFELVDIVPLAEELFAKYGLLLIESFTEGKAVAELVNVDDDVTSIKFTIPLQFIAEPAKFRMNEVQGVGAVVTYYRRYLYMLVLDLVESDGIDNQKPKEDAPATSAPAAPAAPKKSAPPTPAERQETKAEITDAEGAADELMVQGLKDALKALLEKDPEQEGFVQNIAVQTNAFQNLSKTTCEKLIAGIRDMIAAYGD